MVIELRHALATLAYRSAKALNGAPESFAGFKASEKSRTPVEILAHMGDLFDWALCLAEGRHEWHESKPLPWVEETARFFSALGAFDTYLASGKPLGFPAEKLFQGPVADALTHTGQLTFLRGMTGSRVKPENYFKADIVAGCIGRQQAPPRVEY